MLRQAVAAKRPIAGFATQRLPSRLPSSALQVATQRIYNRSLPSSLRQASFLPWRKQLVRPAPPVYFAKPRRWPTRQQIRRKLGYFLLAGVIYYMCWQIWASFVLDSLLDWLDELEMTLSDKEKKELEELEEEPLFFLPFPFGIQTIEQPPYKGSDPEWEMFLKVNKDQNLQKEIKAELTNIVRRSAEKNKALMGVLGKDTKVKKYWLDIIYPRAPPPKHYLSGLIVDEEGIFWGDRPVDALAAKQINAAIYPKAVVLTAWTFMNSLFTQAVQDIAGALGFKNTENQEVSWQSVALDRMKGGLGSTNNQAVNVPGQTDKPPTLNIPAGAGTPFSNPFFGDFQNDSRVQAAMKAATVTFAKNWRPSSSPPVRGCIRVDGVVELQGKRALLAVYVLGWYDPSKKKYVVVESKVKHLLSLTQRPAKG